MNISCRKVFSGFFLTKLTYIKMEKLKSMEKRSRKKICKNDRVILNTPVLPSGDGLGTIFFQPLLSAPILSGSTYVWDVGSLHYILYPARNISLH